MGNKQERLSLVEEDGNALDSAKLAESTKFTPKEQEPKKSDNLNNSTQSYSPPSVYSLHYLATPNPISAIFKAATAKVPKELLSSRRKIPTKVQLHSDRATQDETQHKSVKAKVNFLILT